MELGYVDAERNQRLMRERIQARWMDAYAPTRHVDPILILSVIALSIIGVVMVYSTKAESGPLAGASGADYDLTKQLLQLAVASVAMVAAAVVDYRYLRAYVALIYTGGLILLVAVLTPLGSDQHGIRGGPGTQAWIDLGVFDLQPSELAKVVLVIALAALLHERREELNAATILAAVTLFAVPALLILQQPDLGTFLVFPWTAFMLLMIGGVRARWLLGLVLAGGLAVFLVFHFDVLDEYQLARITAFLDPGNSALAQTSLYNSQQSMIAIGSGGFAGKGFLQGTQTNLSYVPENHTDFIFTVVGEEFGFLGASIVLGLFGLLLWRGLRIAALAKDTFGTLLAVGAVAIFSIQLFINVGMTIGISPVTGIPLPFISYGGTSLLSAYLLVGLLLNVHMRRF